VLEPVTPWGSQNDRDVPETLRLNPTPPAPPLALFKVMDRYLLRQIVVTSLIMTGIGLAILLIERLLRLFSLVANPDKALFYVGQMLILLTPHYLSLALPAAFFFGVLLTFLRLERDNELVLFMSVGNSLGRLLMPVMALAVVMTLITTAIMGYLNPHARYGYRAIKQAVAHASLTAAVREGTFIHAEGLTFYADSSTPGEDGLRLNKVFVYQQPEDGAAVVTTGAHGMLGEVPGSGDPVLLLEGGVRTELREESGKATTLTFRNLSWPVLTAEEEFRPRGRDQRELTLTELVATPAADPSGPKAAELAAELHARLAVIASMPLLPLLAAPLALLGGPRGRRFGVAIGLLVLIVYHEALTFGEALVKRELLTPWLALWGPYALFAAGALYAFRRTARGRPLFPQLS
jgi:lipopolysaccharide export system permease protein